MLHGFEDVDARDKRRHDGHQVMPPVRHTIDKGRIRGAREQD
jgi:hypothetical protein